MKRIIQQKTEQPNRERWILQLRESITDLDQLFDELQLDNQLITTKMRQAKKVFPLRVPKPFLSKIAKGNLHDPLLKQILCDEVETDIVSGYSNDPLNEQQNTIPGLLHKYHNRALLITKTNCAINCRYCFRRHFPYQENQGSKSNLDNALSYIRSQPQLDEIILSGGDPLMAKDHELSALINKFEQIPHIKRIRIHSRLIATLPERATDQLCEIFKNSQLQLIIVTHINHVNEIGQDVKNAMNRLKQANVTLLNQSVLLKGVNDNTDTLANLSDGLFDAGILPYYLHLLDKVQGAAHFWVDDETARQLMRELTARISGYLVPKLAREIAGEKNKTVLFY